MRILSSRLCFWLRAAAIAAATLGSGYIFAVWWPVDSHWLYPAILIGFLSCDASFWSRRSR
jgi:hypothetical protein